MADGFTRLPTRPHLHLIVAEQASAGVHVFTPPRPPSFTHYAGDVYCGPARLSPEAVEELLRLFQCDAGKSGDWSLYDELLSARDGVTEPPSAA